MTTVTSHIEAGDIARLIGEGRLVLHRGAAGDVAARFGSWDELSAALAGGKVAPSLVRMTKQEKLVQAQFYTKGGKIDPAAMAVVLKHGASLVVEEAYEHLPGVGAICADIRRGRREQVKAAAILTTGSGGAFGLHIDPYDLVAIQLEGSKRWLVHQPPVPNAVEGMPLPPPPQGAPAFSEVLHKGDVLFMPRGHWHRCENMEGRSLHVSLAIRPPVGWHAIYAMMPSLLDEEIFRIPLSRFDSPDALAQYELELKRRLFERLNALSLADYLAGGAKQVQS